MPKSFREKSRNKRKQGVVYQLYLILHFLFIFFKWRRIWYFDFYHENAFSKSENYYLYSVTKIGGGDTLSPLTSTPLDEHLSQQQQNVLKRKSLFVGLCALSVTVLEKERSNFFPIFIYLYFVHEIFKNC